MQFQRYSAVSPYRLQPDGSADRAYCRQVAHRLRREAQLKFLAMLARAAWAPIAAVARGAQRIAAGARARTAIPLR